MDGQVVEDDLLGLDDLRDRWGCESVQWLVYSFCGDEQFPKPVKRLGKQAKFFLLSEVVEYERFVRGVGGLVDRIDAMRKVDDWSDLSRDEGWMKLSMMRLA